LGNIDLEIQRVCITNCTFLEQWLTDPIDVEIIDPESFRNGKISELQFVIAFCANCYTHIHTGQIVTVALDSELALDKYHNGSRDRK